MMKIDDEVYVHGFVDEIRDHTVIIHNGGGYFETCKREVSTEFPWSQLVYPTDKFSVIIHDGKIHLINKKEMSVKVNVESKTETDYIRGWTE